MAIGEDKIKDLFSSKLGGFEPEVPASIWSGLDQILSNQPIQASDTTTAQTGDSVSSSSVSTSSSVAGKVSLIKIIAIAAGLAAAIITGVMLLPSDQEIINESPVNQVAEDIQPPVSVEKIESRTGVSRKRPIMAKAAIASQPMISEELIEEAPKADISEEPRPKPKRQSKKSEPVFFANSEVLNETVISKTSKSGLSVGLLANAGLLSQDQSQRGGTMLFSRELRGEAFNAVLQRENSEFDLQHKMPLTFGVTLSKGIAPRLSLETGLTYTYLSSNISSNSALNIEESQSFSYLGIPLSLNYNFYEIGKAKLYLSVGGMIQKDIYGKYISNMRLSITEHSDKGLDKVFYSEPYYIKKTLKQDNPQFSVRTTLGVAYPLYKKMYLYGTIGGAYYFDAGNTYRTIYSDRKTQLDLNLGIKFDF